MPDSPAQREEPVHKSLWFPALISLMVLLIASCGGDGDATPSPATAPASVTASGLQIIDLEAGDGEVAEPGALVTVHYTGWLEDGTKFDSSVDRGQPFDFPLGAGRVIKGWDEGVAGMRIGGRRKLTDYPTGAWLRGDRGRGGCHPAQCDAHL